MKTYLSWGEVEWACQRVSDSLAGDKFDVIVPVVRGGLIPGVILSEMLGVKKVIPITFQLRDGEVCENHLKEWTELVESSYNMLIVEDIVDSGATIDLLAEAYVRRSKESKSSCKFAAVIANNDAKMKYITPHNITSGITIEKDSTPDLWICFPWDKK